MVVNHVRSLVPCPAEHEFPHKRSAFTLQRGDVEWLMGLDDGADFALWRYSLDHCIPAPGQGQFLSHWSVIIVSVPRIALATV